MAADTRPVREKPIFIVRHFVGQGRGDMKRTTNVIALVKKEERYVFLYDERSADTLLRQFGRYASDESLSFTWYDAAVLSQRIRRLRSESADVTDALPRAA